MTFVAVLGRQYAAAVSKTVCFTELASQPLLERPILFAHPMQLITVRGSSYNVGSITMPV
jgi:hypothetical protein